MSRFVLSSPAKLNLFLKVQNKRPDGFHNIVTLFERIDFCDEIEFSLRPGKDIEIRCDHRDVPVGPQNLAHQAARLLQEEFGIEKGVKIKIKKRIPVAAGLGGGSSNGATALLGLNRLWEMGLSRPQLLSLARKMGSDVPFFLYDTSWAVGRGRGDIIKSLNIRKRLWHILVVPKVKMYTWKVYGGLKARLEPGLALKKRSSKALLKGGCPSAGGHMNLLTKINDDVNILIHKLKKDNVLAVGQSLANDLQGEIVRLSPSLETLKKRLNSLNTKGVMISGSGPSVFGLTEDQQEAEEARSILSKRFSRVFVVKTL